MSFKDRIRNPFSWLIGAIVAINLIGAYFLVPPMQPMRAQLGAVETWAGASTGTNAITINLHNIASLNDLLGVPIRFLPAGANTSSATVTVHLDSGSNLGPVNVLKSAGSGGLVSLIGGEFQASQIAAITYDGTQFECGGCTATVAAGTSADYSGVVIPSGWLKADGSAVSRTAQPALFNALVISGVSATTTNTNTSVIVASSANYQIGWFVGGTNVTCNSTISSIPDGTHIVLSAGATGSGAATLTIGPYAQGDCSTTFNIPNYIGRTTAMVDGSTNITAGFCVNAGSIGATCGLQSRALITSNLPAYTPSGSVSSGSVSSTTTTGNGNIQGTVSGSGSPVAGSATEGTNNTGSSLNQTLSLSSSTSTTTTSTFTGNAQGGSSAAFGTLMPLAMIYKIIKT